MSDASAEGELYRDVWNAVYDLRTLLSGLLSHDRWINVHVCHVNEIIADQGYQFRLAQYAEALRPPWQAPTTEQAEALWASAFKLREALEHLNVGHRGWAPVLDPAGDGLLRGTGYELRRSR